MTKLLQFMTATVVLFAATSSFAHVIPVKPGTICQDNDEKNIIECSNGMICSTNATTISCNNDLECTVTGTFTRCSNGVNCTTHGKVSTCTSGLMCSHNGPVTRCN